MSESQHQEEGALIGETQLQRLLEESLPLDEIVYCFAYGSGVFTQQTNNAANHTKVVDLIVVVKDAYRFHQANLLRNPSHYSGSPLLWSLDPASSITYFQRHTFDFNNWLRNPKFYFNLCENNLKYGVIQKEDFLEDLKEWKYLYGAGRWHKPVMAFLEKDDEILEAQQNTNLPGALAAALLSSESSAISLVELFIRIAGISYAGDPRMKLRAEDPNKVDNLVRR